MLRADRHRDGPRQHLPPDPAAGRGADRAPGRPAPLHGLAGADPDRSGGYPGAVARRAARRSTRGGVDLRLASRRRPARLRPSARSTSRACSAPTSRWCSTSAALADDAPRRPPPERRTMRWAERCRAAFRRAPGHGLFGIVQGGALPSLRAESAETLVGPASTATRSAASRSARPQALMFAIARGDRPALPAERPRYLMGVGMPRGSVGAVGARHRSVRLRAADPHGRTARPAPAADRSICATRATARPAPARSGLRLLGLPRAFARLSAPSDQGRGNSRRHSFDQPQSALLSATDGGAALGDRAG